jgi:cell division protein FtsB
VTAPSPPRRAGSHPARRYAPPAAAPSRSRQRSRATESAARGSAAAARRPGGAAGPPADRAGRRSPRLHAGGLTLTTRAALLGLAICAVVLTLAYPAREYLSQHRQINQLAAQVAQDRTDVQALRAAGRRDADPKYVEDQARLRLHMQRPGDQVFELPPPPPRPVGKQKAGAVHTPELPGRSSQPWYSQLYRSTVESGR